MSVTRYMARVQAPLAARFYPDQAHQKITVITYDDEFLKNNGLAWPLSYMDHGDWLLRLVGNPQAKPKAIFLDITFAQERDDPTIVDLANTLCTIQHDYEVPVFLAALPSRENGRLRLHSGLESQAVRNDQPCFTAVGVRHTPDPVDGMTWSYPLTSYVAQGQVKSGAAPTPDTPAFRSAAMAIAQDVAGIDLGQEKEPMALLWGASGQSSEHKSALLDQCRATRSVWQQLLPHALRQFYSDSPARPACPFHTTLSMSNVGAEEDELLPYISGKYLIIGGALDGYNDLVTSPVQGLIPGVQVHAMALDNLLVYQGQYKRHSEWSLPPSAGLFGAGIAAIFSVFVVHILFRRLNSWASRQVSERLPWWGANETLVERCLNLPCKLLLWLLRLWAQIVASMLLIAALQWFFRIGMLPVVELVGMTILAEGLGYLEKTRRFFSESKKPVISSPCSNTTQPKETS